MRSRPNNRHISPKNIKKLRQFVYTGFSNKSTKLSNTTISFFGLFIMCQFIDIHASEFETHKRFIISSGSFLLKKHRPRRFQFYNNHNDRKEPRKNKQDYKTGK